MPVTLTDQQLAEIKYVSMADYVRRVDRLTSFEDKLAFTTHYLARHGGDDNNRDYSFAQAIHIAKMKIMDAAAAAREEFILVPDDVVDPETLNSHRDNEVRDDRPNQRFVADPTDYLYNESIRLVQGMEGAANNEDNQRRMMDYQMTINALFGNAGNEVEYQVQQLEVAEGRTARDLKFRLESKMGGPRGFEKAQEATKPGVLSSMFGTRSVASRNLDDAWKAFNNPDHVYHGNMDTLDKAAIQYLQHRFPRWNPSRGMINLGMINRLSGTAKARALFSYNILQATAEQRKMEKVYDNLTEATRQMFADERADEADVAEQENENAQFQQGLNDQLNRDDEAEFDQEQAERDYARNFEAVEDEPEEEAEVEP